MMSKVVTIKKRNPFIRNGILYSKDIPLLFKDEKFPWKYFEQFLTLLDRFEIALVLDNRRVLIPSMLPEDRPEHLGKGKDEGLVYSRYIMFNSADTPPGFWDRLLSRIMHSIPQVCFALDKTAPSSLAEECMIPGGGGGMQEEPGPDITLSFSIASTSCWAPFHSLHAHTIPLSHSLPSTRTQVYTPAPHWVLTAKVSVAVTWAACRRAASLRVKVIWRCPRSLPSLHSRKSVVQ